MPEIFVASRKHLNQGIDAFSKPSQSKSPFAPPSRKYVWQWNGPGVFVRHLPFQEW